MAKLRRLKDVAKRDEMLCRRINRGRFRAAPWKILGSAANPGISGKSRFPGVSERIGPADAIPFTNEEVQGRQAEGICSNA
jgi:hypothetical protein